MSDERVRSKTPTQDKLGMSLRNDSPHKTVTTDQHGQNDALQSDLLTGQSPSVRSKHAVPAAVCAFLFCTAVVVAAIFALGWLPRVQNEREAAKNTNSDIVPTFTVANVKPAAKTVELTLPANIQAIQEFSIYARCDGYLKRRLVDIGDKVTKGQLLMEIDAPELEHALKRATADLKQSQAQMKSAQADLAQSISMVENNKASVKRLEAEINYSTTELNRYSGLAAQGAISAEQRDEKQRDLSTDRASLEAANAAVQAASAQTSANREKISAANAAVEAARANVDEIQTTASFQRVVAPCDGVVTARNVDAGALVSKGSSTNNQELLKMARTEILRVFVYIPQSDYAGVYVGMPAKIHVAEIPNQAFDGQITHISGGLDPASRTLQAEIQIPNPSGKLMPGMFAQVSLVEQRRTPPVVVPDSAIVVKADGQFVVQVRPNGTTHYQSVVMGKDFGKECEIVQGLQAGDQVIVQPTTEIREGDRVKSSLQ